MSESNSARIAAAVSARRGSTPKWTAAGVEAAAIRSVAIDSFRSLPWRWRLVYQCCNRELSDVDTALCLLGAPLVPSLRSEAGVLDVVGLLEYEAAAAAATTGTSTSLATDAGPNTLTNVNQSQFWENSDHVSEYGDVVQLGTLRRGRASGQSSLSAISSPLSVSTAREEKAEAPLVTKSLVFVPRDEVSVGDVRKRERGWKRPNSPASSQRLAMPSDMSMSAGSIARSRSASGSRSSSHIPMSYPALVKQSQEQEVAPVRNYRRHRYFWSNHDVFEVNTKSLAFWKGIIWSAFLWFVFWTCLFAVGTLITFHAYGDSRLTEIAVRLDLSWALLAGLLGGPVFTVIGAFGHVVGTALACGRSFTFVDALGIIVSDIVLVGVIAHIVRRRRVNLIVVDLTDLWTLIVAIAVYMLVDGLMFQVIRNVWVPNSDSIYDVEWEEDIPFSELSSGTKYVVARRRAVAIGAACCSVVIPIMIMLPRVYRIALHVAQPSWARSTRRDARIVGFCAIALGFSTLFSVWATFEGVEQNVVLPVLVTVPMSLILSVGAAATVCVLFYVVYVPIVYAFTDAGNDVAGPLFVATAVMAASLFVLLGSVVRVTNAISLHLVHVARQNAEVAARASTQLLSVMNHELRTPLHVVSCTLEDLEVGCKQCSTHDVLVQKSVDACRRLENIVDDMLSLTAIRAGHVVCKPTAVSASTVSSAIHQIIQSYVAECQSKSVVIVYSVSREWWVTDSIFELDVVLLRRLVEYLIANSVKFTGLGSILVTIEEITGEVPVGRGSISSNESSAASVFEQASFEFGTEDAGEDLNIQVRFNEQGSPSSTSSEDFGAVEGGVTAQPLEEGRGVMTSSSETILTTSSGSPQTPSRSSSGTSEKRRSDGSAADISRDSSSPEGGKGCALTDEDNQAHARSSRGNSMRAQSPNASVSTMRDGPLMFMEQIVGLRVTVEDTGCGMTELQKRQVFRAFTSESTAHDRKHEGLGLGLTLCGEIVRVLGGSLTLASEVDEGTAVKVDIPINPITVHNDEAGTRVSIDRTAAYGTTSRVVPEWVHATVIVVVEDFNVIVPMMYAIGDIMACALPTGRTDVRSRLRGCAMEDVADELSVLSLDDVHHVILVYVSAESETFHSDLLPIAAAASQRPDLMVRLVTACREEDAIKLSSPQFQVRVLPDFQGCFETAGLQAAMYGVDVTVGTIDSDGETAADAVLSGRVPGDRMSGSANLLSDTKRRLPKLVLPDGDGGVGAGSGVSSGTSASRRASRAVSPGSGKKMSVDAGVSLEKSSADIASGTSSVDDGTTFILVDDDATNLLVLHRGLAKVVKRRPILQARNGQEAVEVYGDSVGNGVQPRNLCVFMDLHMPVCDGFTACARIRAIEKATGVNIGCTIIVLSADVTVSAHSRALEAGADMVYGKPVRRLLLSRLAKVVLGRDGVDVLLSGNIEPRNRYEIQQWYTRTGRSYVDRSKAKRSGRTKSRERQSSRGKSKSPSPLGAAAVALPSPGAVSESKRWTSPLTPHHAGGVDGKTSFTASNGMLGCGKRERGLSISDSRIPSLQMPVHVEANDGPMEASSTVVGNVVLTVAPLVISDEEDDGHDRAGDGATLSTSTDGSGDGDASSGADTTVGISTSPRYGSDAVGRKRPSIGLEPAPAIAIAPVVGIAPAIQVAPAIEVASAIEVAPAIGIAVDDSASVVDAPSVEESSSG